MRMVFAKFVGWLDKPRNGNQILHDGLNFPNYACQVGKLPAGGQVEEGLLVIWRKILRFEIDTEGSSKGT